MLKTKTLVEILDEKLSNSTTAKDTLICPHCGFDHDPEDLDIKKRTQGLIRCSDCGQAFSFEVVKKIAYTTFPE